MVTVTDQETKNEMPSDASKSDALPRIALNLDPRPRFWHSHRWLYKHVNALFMPTNAIHQR